MNKLFYILFFLIFSTKMFGMINEFKGKITKITDGDTIVVNGDIKIRMACVDAYESSINKHLQYQVDKFKMPKEEILKLGQEQKKELEKYVDEWVVVYYDTNNKLDKYNRLLGVVLYDNEVLNKGIKYYNDTFLCKQFLLD